MPKHMGQLLREAIKRLDTVEKKRFDTQQVRQRELAKIREMLRENK